MEDLSKSVRTETNVAEMAKEADVEEGTEEIIEIDMMTEGGEIMTTIGEEMIETKRTTVMIAEETKGLDSQGMLRGAPITTESEKEENVEVIVVIMTIIKIALAMVEAATTIGVVQGLDHHMVARTIVIVLESLLSKTRLKRNQTLLVKPLRNAEQ